MSRVSLLFAVLSCSCAHRGGPPVLDAHLHLRSPQAAARDSGPVLPTVSLPPELATLIAQRVSAQKDRPALGKLYTPEVLFLQSFGPGWLRGRELVADWWVEHTDTPYGLQPVAFEALPSSATIAAYLTDPSNGHLDAHMTLTLTRGAEGQWSINSETLTMGGPRAVKPVLAADLVKALDDAGIQRAVVHSIAYQFASAREEEPGEYEKLKAENDWTAAQVAQSPRLVAFCSVNPLKRHALPELERCAASGKFKGLKLHLGNSRVDFSNARDVELVRAVFAAANARKLPIVVHLAPRENHGKKVGEVFLEQLLPAAADVEVQVAHLASPGRLDPFSDEALGVLADAITKHDARTKNLWFDVTTVIDSNTSKEQAALVARRLRQLGVQRVLYGSDTPDPDRPAPREAWDAFRRLSGLTDEELAIIASNVPPWL